MKMQNRIPITAVATVLIECSHPPQPDFDKETFDRQSIYDDDHYDEWRSFVPPVRIGRAHV